MFKDQVLELDSNYSYYCLEELEKDSKKYVLLSMVNLEKDMIDEENLVVKELIQNELGYETRDIEDDELATKVLQELVLKHRAN